MGAWGFGAFENDDAIDFMADLQDAGSWKGASAEIQQIAADVKDGEFIEAPDACVLLAAAALAAHQQGRPVAAWSGESSLDAYPTCPDKVINTIAAALPRAIRGPDSELRELWQDTDDYKDWIKECEAILAALK
jgi:7-cyano-7-deazaguanine synthase in queuosine biosynthesis